MLHTRMNSTVGQLYFNIHSERDQICGYWGQGKAKLYDGGGKV